MCSFLVRYVLEIVSRSSKICEMIAKGWSWQLCTFEKWASSDRQRGTCHEGLPQTKRANAAQKLGEGAPEPHDARPRTGKSGKTRQPKGKQSSKEEVGFIGASLRMAGPTDGWFPFVRPPKAVNMGGSVISGAMYSQSAQIFKQGGGLTISCTNGGFCFAKPDNLRMRRDIHFTACEDTFREVVISRLRKECIGIPGAETDVLGATNLDQGFG